LYVCGYNKPSKHTTWEAIFIKINYNTQISVELAQEINDYLKDNPGLSKAALTEAALKEYMEKAKTASK
jgi:hypothetical protein